MRISASFQVPRIDLSKYKDALRRSLSEAISKAAFSWLGATTSQIPVWSGASLATFRRLALAIHFQVDSATASKAPDRVDLGLNNSTGSVDVKSAADGKVAFSYSTTLAHLIYNEFNNANITPDPTLFSKLKRPGPYGFQAKGQAAFDESVRNIRLPDLTDSIVTKSLRVS